MSNNFIDDIMQNELESVEQYHQVGTRCPLSVLHSRRSCICCAWLLLVIAVVVHVRLSGWETVNYLGIVKRKKIRHISAKAAHKHRITTHFSYLDRSCSRHSCGLLWLFFTKSVGLILN